MDPKNNPADHFDTRDFDLEGAGATHTPIAHDAPTEGPSAVPPGMRPSGTPREWDSYRGDVAGGSPSSPRLSQRLRTVAASLVAACVVAAMAGVVVTFAHPGAASTPQQGGVTSLAATLPTDTAAASPTTSPPPTSTPVPPTATPVPHIAVAYTCVSGQYAPGGTGQPDDPYLLHLCIDAGSAVAGDYLQIDMRYCGAPAPVGGGTSHITVVLDGNGKRDITDPFAAPDCANPLPVAGVVTVTTPDGALLGTADGFSLAIAH